MIISLTAACNFSGLLEEALDDGYSEESAPEDEENLYDDDQIGIAAPQGEPGTWLVMLYQDADDDTLERDVFLDLNEAEVIGSSDMVTIVSQIDRYDGGFDGDDDWTSTKRFLISQDDDLETINSEEIEDLGEVNMSDPQTLIDFASWAINSFPAEHYVLIMSDHGMGWLGGWTDPEPYDDDMSMKEIDDALSAIVYDTGIGQFDLFGFDACLMAQLEVFSTLAPYAKYAVASEETEPTVGWAYAAFLGALVDNPAITPADLAITVVDSYIQEDIRIIDDEARVSFIEENYDYGDDMSAAEVAADMSRDVTLTAVDLSYMADLNSDMNNLSLALIDADQTGVAAARSYSQSYTSVFDKGYPESFIDLGSFVALAMDETGDSSVARSGQELLDTLEQAVIAEMHGELKPGSTGISFYFPNSRLYTLTTDEDFVSYTSTTDRFAAASLWDDFLAFHYSGKDINTETVDLSVLQPMTVAEPQDFSDAIEASAPESGAEIESPASGGIELGEVNVSASEIGPEDTITISADVSGSNLAYLYYFVDYYYEEFDSYLMADIGYLNADYINEVNGMVYPDWEDGTFTIETDWTPTVFYLSDGLTESFIYLEPETYGTTYEEDVYILYGLYAPGGDPAREQEAMLKFDGNFELRSFWVFTGADGTGAPREAIMREGDTFSVWQLWQEYNPDTDLWEYAYYLGETLTYTGTPFEVIPYYAFAGSYEVGIMAEDFDGNTTSSYAEITVTE